MFWNAKDSAADAADAAASRALELLAGISSMRLVPEEPAHIYRPMVEYSDGGTSMGPGHIPKDAINALAQLAVPLSSAPLRARVADLVWLLERSRGRQFPLTQKPGSSLTNIHKLSRLKWIHESRHFDD